MVAKSELGEDMAELSQAEIEKVKESGSKLLILNLSREEVSRFFHH